MVVKVLCGNLVYAAL
ncbi:hypothetical protein M2G93_22620, partial [Vibrio vulnificus]|nr:hypothetical protein [Vibrio vulnificus]